jgi:hypothetical protein
MKRCDQQKDQGRAKKEHDVHLLPFGDAPKQ